MFKRLSAKLKKDKDVKKLDQPIAGGAVPYHDPDEHGNQTTSRVSGEASTKIPPHYANSGKPSSSHETSATVNDTEMATRLGNAAAKSDINTIRYLLRAKKVDINCTDENGNTALHRAAAAGKTHSLRYLLLHGADMEPRNKDGQNVIFVAVDYHQTSTVGVLLDYMHSVDNRPRESFVMIRAKKTKNNSYILQHVKNSGELKPFQKRGVDLVQMLIAHGQHADDMSIFLYSVLDVSVEHTFFLNFLGELNMRNFQRFENKNKSISLTILNSVVRGMDITGYDQLRYLILVSCDMVKLILDDLPCLELLDVRYNKLDSLPETLGNCKQLKTLRCAHNYLKRLPSRLGDLSNTLMVINCSYNLLKRLTSKLVNCTRLKSLECDHNGIMELPIDIGLLTELEELHVSNNKLSRLPLSVASLGKLKSISFHSNPLLNIPTDFPEGVSEVQQYMQALQDDPVPNTTVKLVLVGQEGVGKTTLLKALKKTFWMIPSKPNTPKTDGIDIKNIKLKDMTLRCFDCGGDVDFNETHNFFITQGALYVVCFNLAEYCVSTIERGSFLLGRLQLWVQYIFSKVPNAQVIIVGTHADHASLTRKIFEEIWEQIRALLVKAREHHRQFFKHKDRLHDCLICQADVKCLRRMSNAGQTGFVNMGYDDNTSVEDDSNTAEGTANVCFPHIVGYYEVSSVKSIGNNNPLKINANASIDNLKDAILDVSKRLTKTNQELPRRWANVQESLLHHIEMNPDNALATLNDVAKIAQAQGVTSRNDLVNMLQFLKAQGNVLYFPQLENLQDTVILDPEWLAKIFSSVISYRDTGFDMEGFIHRETLMQLWKEQNLHGNMVDKVLTLLRHFGVCLPVSDDGKEMFPCKLPLGEPDEMAWPISLRRGEKQITYRVTFPSIIPPPYFSNLLVAVYKSRAPVSDECKPSFYSNKIVDWLSIDQFGCIDCGLKDVKNDSHRQDPVLVHRVLIELIPHIRTIQITVRGHSPCCMLVKIKQLLKKVTNTFEGLGTTDIETIICSGCFMQGSKVPHRYSIKHLREETQKKEKVICSNAHILPDSKHVLCGVVNETCLPLATIRPKAARDKFDYSGCPKLFIMLPVNKDGISFDKDLKLFTSSLMFDGYAAHLLCEFPDGYHITKTPGYRIKDPKEFMERFGVHVMTVFKLLQHMTGSTVSPQYANQTNAITRVITNIIHEFEQKFPVCKCTAAQAEPEFLHEQIQQRAAHITRDDLRRVLHIMDRPDSFGPLRRLKYGDSLMWLCNEHYRQMRVISIGDRNIQAYVESSA